MMFSQVLSFKDLEDVSYPKLPPSSVIHSGTLKTHHTHRYDLLQ